MKIYDLLIKLTKPFVKMIAGWHLPFTRKRVTGRDYYQHAPKIKVGDILLTRTNGEISNIFNMGEFKHGALYVGGNTIKNTIESTGKGVCLTDLVTFMTSKDLVLCLRPRRRFTEQEIKNYAASFVGYKYDFDFKLMNKRFYCYELVAEILEKAIPNFRVKRKKVFGGMAFTYKSFLKDSENFEIVFKAGE